MQVIIFDKTIKRTYKNNGQNAEQIARYNLINSIESADNKPATECADCLDIQIKSARATVCKGLDLKDYLEKDKANRYGYVVKDGSKMYLMSKIEWFEFVQEFKTVDRESKKNGGGSKLRLLSESKRMIKWLSERA